ncbi:MAG: histidine biosynthesis protein [Gammaproteobacteria bacterium HGW-Gammaproteobacteria-6]|jgi:DNA-binding protein H-NS|nr:MAG: histidine biosynthesis protein [Gammaproteobacteria bacterium HGW-Gammaproteobacteria-6]PKM16436.1 MAG: histidine biosynthesis protein [Gammaproteobacteria bacterium HGW-Gammaproteobacteria-2]
MQIDLGTLSKVELDALIAKAERQKKKIHRQKINDVRRKVAALAKENGYSIEELFGGAKVATKVVAKVAPKYRNPANPEKTWSGRGKRPRWFNEALAKGRKESDMLI